MIKKNIKIKIIYNIVNIINTIWLIHKLFYTSFANNKTKNLLDFK